MNNGFLRPRENRCKWFNCLGVMKKWIYIEIVGKWKFSSKNNFVNRFTKYLNRFRPLKTKLEKRRILWRLICIDSKSPKMKVDTIQNILIRFKESQKVFMIRFTHFLVDSKLNRFEISWNDSQKVRNLCNTIQTKMNRFRSAENEFWQWEWSEVYLNHKVFGTATNHSAKDTDC